MTTSMGSRLSGKIAVVTAAAQGIGRAVAERLMAEGARVHASDLNEAGLADLGSAGHDCLDATDDAAVRAYFGRLERVDILVHAVGYVHQGTIEECDAQAWRRSLDVNMTGAYNVIGAALPSMKAAGGSIIAIASVAGAAKGLPRRAAYGATKAGVVGLCKSVAADYLKDGIRCNAVCPGTVRSPLLEERIDELARQMGDRDKAYRFFMDRQPSGRFGEPAEIAGLCAYLASEESAFITGQAIGIDGGMTI